MRFYHALKSPLCTCFSDNADYTDLVMSTEWRRKCIPKDILYSELTSGKRPAGCPQLHFKDVCKCDTIALNVDNAYWKEMVCDQVRWKTTLQCQLSRGEYKIQTVSEVKRAHQKNHHALNSSASKCNCPNCSRDCHSSTGLTSHS